MERVAPSKHQGHDFLHLIGGDHLDGGGSEGDGDPSPACRSCLLAEAFSFQPQRGTCCFR